MRKTRTLLNSMIALGFIMMLVSCYKFGRIAAPKVVNPNEAFEGRIVAVNDNSLGPASGYSIFAVRVPENWTVEVGDNAYQQYATGDITIPGDANDPTKPAEKANITDRMHYSAQLSSFYNQSNPKEGYTWMAFVTDNVHRRGLQGHQNNSCDSIALNYRVLNDGVAGEYELDYIIGDEEKDFEQYGNDVRKALGTRVYWTSTEASTIKKDDGNEAFNLVQPEYKTKVKVLEGGTPVVHKPMLSVAQEEVPVGETVTVNYEEMKPETRLEVFKYADLMPVLAGSMIVEGEQVFNKGNYEVSNLEPGVYHVRAFESTKVVAETTFSVAYPEFMGGDASLFVINDLHLMAPELLVEEGDAFDAYRMGDAKLYKESPAIVNAVVAKVLEVKPTALLIGGDLTKDGERVSHALLASLLKPVTDAGIKVYVVPGDHDVNNPTAAIYSGATTTPTETVTADEFAEIYAPFGFADAVSRDETSLSYMAYPTDKLAVLCLDACRYNENLAAADATTEGGSEAVLVREGRLTKETLAWMTTAVADAQASGRKVVALMHHLVSAPFNGYDVVGPVVNGQSADLASMFAGGSEEGEETEPPYEVSNGDVQDAFAKAGISVIFTGDAQATDIQHVTTPSEGKLYQVTTGALISFDCPYRLVSVTEEGLDIDTRVIKEVEGIELPEGMTLEDYAYDRLKNDTPRLVEDFCAKYWDIIDPIFKDNFTFEYNEGDLINKNDFMRLPESPEDMAQRVNNNITQPLINIIATFVEGNEHLKDSQKLVDDLKAGFDGFFDSLNTLPSIITPMIKEGFAEAGLDTDALVESVVGSLAYNYLGAPDNVSNDLFIHIPFGEITGISAVSDNVNVNNSAVYDLQGRRMRASSLPKGIYVKDGKKMIVK